MYIPPNAPTPSRCLGNTDCAQEFKLFTLPGVSVTNTRAGGKGIDRGSIQELFLDDLSCIITAQQSGEERSIDEGAGCCGNDARYSDLIWRYISEKQGEMRALHCAFGKWFWQSKVKQILSRT